MGNSPARMAGDEWRQRRCQQLSSFAGHRTGRRPTPTRGGAPASRRGNHRWRSGHSSSARAEACLRGECLGSELTDAFQRGAFGPGRVDLPVRAGIASRRRGASSRTSPAGGASGCPSLPRQAFIETAPDWVCELLSPSTESYDRWVKRRIYAEVGVTFFWLLDPRAEFLETLLASRRALDGRRDLLSADDVSAPPFDAISFPLSVLWPFGQQASGSETQQNDH